MTTLPMHRPIGEWSRRSESTESNEPVRVQFSVTTSEIELAPSFSRLLAYVVHHLRDDEENRRLFLNDLLEADSSDDIEWVIEQWAETIELEENEPELVVDLFKKLADREG